MLYKWASLATLTPMCVRKSFGCGVFGLFFGAWFLEGAWSYSVDLETEAFLPSSLDDGSAESERWGAEVSVAAAYVPARGQKYGISFALGRTEYDWSGPVPLSLLGHATTTAPVGELRHSRIGVEASRMFSPKWGIFARGGYGWNVAESDWVDSPLGSDARASDGGRGFGMVGATWVFGPNLVLSGGIAYSERLEESDLVLPLIFLRWKIDEHWVVTTARGVTLHYDLFADGQHQVFAGIAYESDSFALLRSVEGPSGNFGSLAGSSQSVRLSLGYAWKPTEAISLSPFVTYDLGEELEFRAFGRSVGKIDFENRFGVGFRISGRF